ncbi:MAG: hypothetical protein IJ172_08630 [Ruminococcus sp.]|nr:hypothetical protein [Ruminococcus sp.]
MPDSRSRSWFLVWANPDRIITYKHAENGDILKDENGKNIVLSDVPNPDFADMTEQEICNKVLNMWTATRQGRSGAVVFCLSADGLRHLHIVAESNNPVRFSTIKKIYPKAHAEATQGTKQDVEDYIAKVGKFEEKGELILARAQVGEIQGKQGARTDLTPPDKLHELIYDLGKTPSEILDEFPNAYKQEGILKKMYYRKRFRETPIERDVNVTWLVGATGTGKTYKYVELCEEYGEDNVYKVTDYDAPFDSYNGQDVLFLEEYRGAFSLPRFLILLDKYKADIHARYTNALGLWTNVYITSPCLPYELYTKYKDTSGGYDSLEQLYRRINTIVYCSKVETPRNIYYFRNSFDCDIKGNADHYRMLFDDALSDNKTAVNMGFAQSISDCVFIKNKNAV